MEIKFKNDDFRMFTGAARDELQKHVESYSETLKNESERIAASRFAEDADIQVSKDMVQTVIGLHGHHVYEKRNVFFTYILPLLEALAGGIFCNTITKDTKSTSDIVLAVVVAMSIVISIILRHFNNRKG